MKTEEINIHLGGTENIQCIKDISMANQTHKDETYWDLSKIKIKKEELSLIIAKSCEGDIIGYGFLNWKPKYRVYEQLNIPEIQDLNVLKDYRRQGIGKRMIEKCEDIAREEGRDQIGISYGLSKNYGHAQRLYTSMGYIPDGFGVTYDREPVSHGQFRSIDDNLCLMLIKEL